MSRDIDPVTRELFRLLVAQANAELAAVLRARVNAIRREYGMPTREQEQAQQVIDAFRVLAVSLKRTFRKFAPAMRQIAAVNARMEQARREDERLVAFSRSMRTEPRGPVFPASVLRDLTITDPKDLP